MSEFSAWPHAVLASGDVRLTVLLPDAAEGYYRGPRFDWSAMVALAEWKGHTFFGSWKQAPHDPAGNDDAAGTASELGMGPLTGNPSPIGYDAAKPGEAFLKVGVGRLLKAAAEPYSFGALYRLERPALWDTDLGHGRIAFTTEEEGLRGHAFLYRSSVVVLGGEGEGGPGFRVEHSLENRGTAPIVQTHYCHNFTRIDDEPIGPGYRIELPWQPRFAQTAGSVLAAAASGIEVARPVGADEGFFALVEGYRNSPADNAIVLRGQKAGLRIAGSEPIDRLQVFGTARTLCPEPFNRLEILPGASRSWSTTYRFLRFA